MKARRKSGVIEDLFGIAAALPWWAGVTVAIITYGILHHYAEIGVPASAVIPGQIGHMVVEQMGRVFAYYGHYILPLLFFTGALASFIKQRKCKNLVRTVDNGKTDNALHDITWRDFESLVGEVFRMRGFSVVENGRGGADGGIDLILKKDGEVFLVQCKQWRAYKVSVNIVRELLGVMVSKGAAGGFVVTSGVFTAEAQSFAKGQNIELLDGPRLMAMIEKARTADSVRSSVEQRVYQTCPPAPTISTVAPSCPSCGDAMVKRVAKHGTNSGNIFWGCTGFPKCRGIRSALLQRNIFDKK